MLLKLQEVYKYEKNMNMKQSQSANLCQGSCNPNIMWYLDRQENQISSCKSVQKLHQNRVIVLTDRQTDSG